MHRVCFKPPNKLYHFIWDVLGLERGGTRHKQEPFSGIFYFIQSNPCIFVVFQSLGIHVHDDTSTVSSDDDDHSHEAIENEKEHALNAVWKGFFVLVGIFSFFIIEQLMGVCQQARKTKKVCLI